jgi:phage baseplate assembly protein W
MAYPILAGISWPFRIQGGGLPAAAKGTEVIRSALIVLLRTPKRSRVMRPTLGNNLQRLIFETNGATMKALVQREITTMISNFLPQVKIITMNFTTQDTLITADIKYSVQGVLDTTGPITIGMAA